MPVMDGFEATRQIRRIPALSDVIVIAVSANVFQQTRKESAAAGCHDFLVKPVQLEDLVELLRTHLQIDWIYEEAGEKTESDVQADAKPAPLVPLPPQETAGLLELARLGMAKQLLSELSQIESQAPKYLPLIKKLHYFAKQYQFDQIIELLECGSSIHLPETSIIPPPMEELSRLNQLALIGDIMEIRERIEKIEALDPRFASFVARVRQLAEELNILEIQQFLKHYIEPE